MSMPSATLQSVATQVGCTREWVRQVVKFKGQGKVLPAWDRYRVRRISKEAPPVPAEGPIAHVYAEAVKHGLQVEWIRCRANNASWRTTVLRINGHLCHIAVSHQPRNTNRTLHPYIFFTNASNEPSDFTIGVQLWADPLRYFIIPTHLLQYFYPGGRFYIPMVWKAPYRNMKSRINFRQFENNWGLLANPLDYELKQDPS